MTWVGLRKKGVEVLYPEEWNLVIDALDELKNTKLDTSQLTSVPSDVKPDSDNARMLGDASHAWREVHAHVGQFKDALYVAGKPVIKDGDPITISELSPTAQANVANAIESYVTQLTPAYGEVDTPTVTPPVAVVTPPSDKKVSIRSILLETDSTSGEVSVKFGVSGSVIAKLYCSRLAVLNITDVVINGGAGEAVQLTWSGLSSGAKIFYIIMYKLV